MRKAFALLLLAACSSKNEPDASFEPAPAPTSKANPAPNDAGKNDLHASDALRRCAFISLAFKPEPGTFVTIPELEELHRLCTMVEDEGPRCAMIHALFDYGEITQGAFSPVVETFF